MEQCEAEGCTNPATEEHEGWNLCSECISTMVSISGNTEISEK